MSAILTYLTYPTYLIYLTYLTYHTYLKGTVSRDVLLLVLFMNQFPPSPRVFQ